ncbi:transposase [bacterium]|nr:transposase [bacterium]MBU1982842.1 transposase [bacterium]
MPKSVRLPHYNYGTTGGYFLTLCTHNKECQFGVVADGIPCLNEYGRIIEREWKRSAEIRKELGFGDFVIMPNHLHGIVFIKESDGAHCRAALPSRAASPEVYLRGSRDREKHSISTFVAGFKSYTTKLINELRKTPGARLWQPNYFEHVIRNEEQARRACEYIQTNPIRWKLDKYHPR